VLTNSSAVEPDVSQIYPILFLIDRTYHQRTLELCGLANQQIDVMNPTHGRQQPPPFQIISRFDFFRYIDFIMRYISGCIEKTIQLKKSKRLII
jgi:hypothetical protein